MRPVAYRGRLIRPFLAEIYRLDTAATRAGGGYDDVWRTTKPGGRREMAPIQLPAQIEVGTDGAQNQGPGGNLPDVRFQLAFHFADLERLGLVDGNGDPLLRVNDRLARILTMSGAVKRVFPNPPGLFATEVQPREYGLGGDRNLLLISWNDRPQGRQP